jgi:hypothetical protein
MKFAPRDVSLDVAGLNPTSALFTRNTAKKTVLKLDNKAHEVVYLRWRSGYVFLNSWKATYNIGDIDAVCRFCHQDDETIEHLLLCCEGTDGVREAYLSRVSNLLNCDVDDLSKDCLLGLNIPHQKSNIHRQLASLLHAYVNSLDLHV